MDNNPSDASQLIDRMNQRIIEAGNLLKAVIDRASGDHLVNWPINGTWIKTMASLLTGVSENARKIRTVYENGDFSTCAFYCRNILELVVWIRYCLDKDRAASFQKDLARDFIGLIRTMRETVPYHGDPSPIDDIEMPNPAVLRVSSALGVSTDDESYTTVRKAARILAIESFFVTHNTLLSKFAHPTALVVLGLSGPEIVADNDPESFIQMCYFTLHLAVRLSGDAATNVIEFTKQFGAA
jgi:hypothetical protein